VFKPLHEVRNPREPLLKREVLSIPQPDIVKYSTCDEIDFDFDFDWSFEESEVPYFIDLDCLDVSNDSGNEEVKLPPPIVFD
jgi:hypothetical protein